MTTDHGFSSTVPSSQLAAQRCEQGMPDIIVVDERFNDDRFEQLRVRLMQRQPNFPMVEITYSSELPLSLEGWGDGRYDTGKPLLSRRRTGPGTGAGDVKNSLAARSSWLLEGAKHLLQQYAAGAHRVLADLLFFFTNHVVQAVQ